MAEYVETLQYYLREQGYTEDHARELSLVLDEKFMLICQNKIEEEHLPPLVALLQTYQLTKEAYGEYVGLVLAFTHAERLRELEAISEGNKHFASISPLDSPYVKRAEAYLAALPIIESGEPPSNQPTV